MGFSGFIPTNKPTNKKTKFDLVRRLGYLITAHLAYAFSTDWGG